MTQRKIQRVAVVGAGAMGAMYAAHFTATGFDVSLIATGERAARLREEEVTVNGVPLGVPVLDPAEGVSGPADLVLFAVKDAQLADAVASVAPLVAAQTTLLSVLNGLDSETVIAARYGAQRVPLCIALAMDAQREGREVSYTQSGRLVFGFPPEVADRGRRVEALGEACDRAGLAWSSPADMRREMWWKFMVNVGVNQASAVLRAPYGAFVPEGPARSLMLALIDEVIAVGRAERAGLGQDDLDRWHKVLAGQPARGRTSMLQDVDAGRPTEVDMFAGRVIALGMQHNIPTPVNQTVAWILHARAESPAPAPRRQRDGFGT